MKRSCLLGNMSLFLKVTIYNCLALCFPHFSQAICVEREGFSNCSFQLQNKYLLHNIVPQCLGAASIFPSSHVAIFIGHENKQSHFPIYHAHICVYLYTISSSQQLCFDLKQTPHALPIPENVGSVTRVQRSWWDRALGCGQGQSHPPGDRMKVSGMFTKGCIFPWLGIPSLL